MSGKDLFEGMSYVDERFVDEAENKSLPKRIVSPWIKTASMAACLCLIIFTLYQLQPSPAPEALGRVQDTMPGSAVEDENEQISQEPAIAAPEDAPATSAPEMMVCIQEITENGFVGTVQNNGGFTVFDDGTEITVTIDMETDPDFKPEDYEIGDLIYVIYTTWDEEERTIIASILGVVDEPIFD